MKRKLWFSTGTMAAALILPAAADVLYSDFENLTIPYTLAGVMVTIDGGTLNAAFGGVAVYNNDLLQPVRATTAGNSTLQNIGVGDVIDSNKTYATGYGVSTTHLGNTFISGEEGYVGFKINETGFGWARVVFATDGSAKIKDWAYDTSGAINVGRVQQSAALSGAQTVTLSPGIGESFTLGSLITNTGDNINSVVKTGAGTTTLSVSNSYTGATLISDGTLALGALGSIDNTSEVSLGTVGTFDVSAKVGGYTVGTLKGSGNVTGALSVSTQLAIGNSPGTMNFSSSLTIGSLATFLYDVTSGATPGLGSADLGDIAGALTISSGAILDLVQLGTYTPGNKFTLFAYDGTLTGTFADTSSASIGNGDTFTDGGGIWQILYADSTPGSNGGISASGTYVTITAIPEPNFAALLGGVGLLALLRRRR